MFVVVTNMDLFARFSSLEISTDQIKAVQNGLNSRPITFGGNLT